MPRLVSSHYLTPLGVYHNAERAEVLVTAYLIGRFVQRQARDQARMAGGWNERHSLWLFWSLPFLPLLSSPHYLPQREEEAPPQPGEWWGKGAWGCSHLIQAFVRSATGTSGHGSLGPARQGGQQHTRPAVHVPSGRRSLNGEREASPAGSPASPPQITPAFC